jgi:hypothetical protein
LGNESKKKAWTKGQDPKRCAKITDAKLGKKRPPHVIEAMGIGRTGKPYSAETRKKMSIREQISISLISKTIEVFFLLHEKDANLSHLISPKGVSAL